LGSDSAATLITSTGQRTSMQPIDKLDIIANKIILGVSGSVGIAQFFKAGIEKLWNDKSLSGKDITEAKNMLAAALRENLHVEFKAVDNAPAASQNYFSQGVFTNTLIALPVDKKPVLIEFDPKGSPEEKNEKLPTVAIGSAQQIVDPFLAFLRRIFWKDQLPNLAEGKLAAYWSLDFAIKSAPGGIGPPIKLSILEKINDNWQARELSEKELNEQAEAADGIEDYIRDFKPSKENIEEVVAKPPEPKQILFEKK
jgi:hypothetical protein